MSSTTGSKTPPREAVRRVALVRHGRPETTADAQARLAEIAAKHGVELVHEDASVLPDLAVVLGGDGTMLRAFHRFLGTDVPVLGINFGRVGFLASIEDDDLEAGLAQAFRGDYRVVELPTLDVETGGKRSSAVNDVVVTSSVLGRMVELAWAVGGEDLGVLPCDGMICCTPSGSTAYNLSNGGPVLVWGLDAMAITFVAPHSLHARPLVVPRRSDLTIVNRTAGVGVTVIVDGKPFHEPVHEEPVNVRLGDQHCRLATLPQATFFSRYRETFAS
jgi:NAD+ kinase